MPARHTLTMLALAVATGCGPDPLPPVGADPYPDDGTETGHDCEAPVPPDAGAGPAQPMPGQQPQAHPYAGHMWGPCAPSLYQGGCIADTLGLVCIEADADHSICAPTYDPSACGSYWGHPLDTAVSVVNYAGQCVPMCSSRCAADQAETDLECIGGVCGWAS